MGGYQEARPSASQGPSNSVFERGVVIEVKSDEFIALLQSVDFFFEANKGLSVIGSLKPFISTEHSFLKHLVQFKRSLVFKCQRDFHFFPENQRLKNIMICPPLYYTIRIHLSGTSQGSVFCGEEKPKIPLKEKKFRAIR